jgi:ADP-ribose pyrophosphatase
VDYDATPVPILPALPKVELETVRDVPASDVGFLSVKRRDLVLIHQPDGTKSTTFRYDVVERRALDASVMVAHYTDHQSGVLHVYLRSAIRPPVALRHIEPAQLSSVLWEVPAGLIEPGEEPRAAAARELDEELGFAVKDEEMLPLGGWSFPAPGFIGEMHWFFHVQVDPTKKKDPGGDGSPLEEASLIIAVPLTRALEACVAGEIRDAKTEIALHRLSVELLKRTK